MATIFYVRVKRNFRERASKAYEGQKLAELVEVAEFLGEGKTYPVLAVEPALFPKREEPSKEPEVTKLGPGSISRIVVRIADNEREMGAHFLIPKDTQFIWIPAEFFEYIGTEAPKA